MRYISQIIVSKDKKFKRAGWYSGKYFGVYSGGARFESRPRHRKSWQLFTGFPRSFQNNAPTRPRPFPCTFCAPPSYCTVLKFWEYSEIQTASKINRQEKQSHVAEYVPKSLINRGFLESAVLHLYPDLGITIFGLMHPWISFVNSIQSLGSTTRNP
jgi:hypothetical protein